MSNIIANWQKRKKVLSLANELCKLYPNSDFSNHCYLRIAYDSVCQEQWDKIYKSPAYKNMEINKIEQVIDKLESYKNSFYLVRVDNNFSLRIRGKI